MHLLLSDCLFEYRKPCIQYPFDIVDRPSNLLVTDFVLVAQRIPATTPASIRKANVLPITITTPGILLGLRATEVTASQSGISNNELKEITAFSRPHLQALIMHLRYSMRGKEGPISIPPWLTVFTMYLKAGELHILASYPDDWLSGFHTSTVLVDTLPVQRLCDNADDISFRLRLGIAIFTLQQHVVRVSTHLHHTWPEDLLIEEHALITCATGISTPTPSECLFAADDDDDDGYEAEKQETTAEKRARLEQCVQQHDGSHGGNSVVSCSDTAIPSWFNSSSGSKFGEQQLKDQIHHWLRSVNEAHVADEPAAREDLKGRKRNKRARVV